MEGRTKDNKISREALESRMNLTYYPGKDLYSDGDVEEELLSVVSATPSEKLEEYLTECDSWAHLYHLSKIRHQILDWYDFNPKGSLLEIGSGCGAMTGLFCEKCDHVVAIELSKRRSTINLTRNANYENLTIMLGNFEEIKLQEKFDYVTLIGVFEYSINYMHSDHPFEDMLQKVKSFLKPGGTLFIAIENKWGLKYLAGATEDHSGHVGDGIENYVNVDRVRTFSRGTLLQMLSKAGFASTSVYYPMADYKLPDELYSDAHLPGFGSIRRPCVAYDRGRYELFDERLAFDGLCEDGLFPEHANSFLMISKLEDSEVREGQAEYVKYTRMRAPKYQVCTKIYGDHVVRMPLSAEGNEHIQSLVRKEELLRNSRIRPAKVQLKTLEHGILQAICERVEGNSLSKDLQQALEDHRGILPAMKKAMETIYGSGKEEESLPAFTMTEEFRNLFGVLSEEEEALLTKGKTYPVTNVDQSFQNILRTKDGELVNIDYEWTYEFPIPVEYVKYRTVFYYYWENLAYMSRQITEEDLLKTFGWSRELIQVFVKMDDAFQQEIHGRGRKYNYLARYEKHTTNIGKNLQQAEPWFLSVMEDLDGLNRTMGPFRRNLWHARIDAYKESAIPTIVKERLGGLFFKDSKK